MDKEQRKKVEKIIKKAREDIEETTGMKTEAIEVDRGGNIIMRDDSELDYGDFSSMSSEEMLEYAERAADRLGEKQRPPEDLGTVEKSFPAKPEWVKKDAEMDKLITEVHALGKRVIKCLKETRSKVMKINSMKKGFWADIEQELGIYERKMNFNTERKEVEVYMSEKDEKKKKPVKSPIQMNP